MEFNQICHYISSILNSLCDDNTMIYHYKMTLNNLKTYYNEIDDKYTSVPYEIIDKIKLEILKVMLKKLIPNEPLYSWEIAIISLQIGKTKLAHLLELDETDYQECKKEIDVDDNDIGWYDEINNININTYYEDLFEMNDSQKISIFCMSIR